MSVNLLTVRWRRASIMLALLFALVGFAVTHWATLADSLLRFNAIAIAIALITLGLQWYVGSFRDVLLIHTLTSSYVSVTRVVVLNLQQYLFNLLPFAMGTLLKANRYREEMNVPYAQFGSMFLVQYFVLIGVSTAWGIVATVWLGHSMLTILFLLIFASAVACLFAPRPIALWGPRFARCKLLEMHEGISLMLSNSRTFWAVVSLGIVCHGLQCVRLLLLLRCVDPSIAFSDSLLYAAMAHLSLLLMITPSGLGLRELLFAGIANATNHSVVATVLVALVERVLALGLALGVIVVSVMVFDRGMKDTAPANVPEVET